MRKPVLRMADSHLWRCSPLAVGALESADTQVVAGKNYRMTFSTVPQGSISLVVFEQPWTETLQITQATHKPSDEAGEQTLINTPQNLDYKEFDAHVGAALSTAAKTGDVDKDKDAEQPRAAKMKSKMQRAWTWLKSKALRR